MAKFFADQALDHLEERGLQAASEKNAFIVDLRKGMQNR
jgi:cytochrome P450